VYQQLNNQNKIIIKLIYVARYLQKQKKGEKSHGHKRAEK